MATDSSTAYADFGNPLASLGSGSFGPWFGNMNFSGMGGFGGGGVSAPWMTNPSWLGSIFGGGAGNPWMSLAGLMGPQQGIQGAGNHGGQGGSGLLSPAFTNAINSLGALASPGGQPSFGSFPNFNSASAGQGNQSGGGLLNFQQPAGHMPIMGTNPGIFPSLGQAGTPQPTRNNGLNSL